MDEYERFLRLELERAGLVISRWLAGFWQRKPCDDWLPEIEAIFANLARDQLFVEQESREVFIAWLAAVNAAAKEQADQFGAKRKPRPVAMPCRYCPAGRLPLLPHRAHAVAGVLRQRIAQVGAGRFGQRQQTLHHVRVLRSYVVRFADVVP